MRFINDDIFWEIVQDLSWGKTYDLKQLGEKLIYLIDNKNEIETLRLIAVDKRKTLDDVIKAHEIHANKTSRQLDRYWGGDDSYWDFRAHIVGLGRDAFHSVILDINNLSIGENYKENFEYLFRYSEEFSNTPEGKRILELPLSRKKILYNRITKLKKIL